MTVARKIMCVIVSYVLSASTGAGEIVPTNEADVKNATQSRYTRLDAEGRAVSGESVAACVRDAVTGLVWELKTDDGGIHDKDNSYRWGGMDVELLYVEEKAVERKAVERKGLERDGVERKSAKANGVTVADDWNSLLTVTNNNTLCGFEDWRVPAIDELQSLILSGREPTIDTDYFPRTLPNPYWSISPYANYPEHGQTVHFGNGTSYYYNGYHGNRLPVRLVRGTQSQ